MSKYQRQIFYISGFDPRGADYYYKLYKHEAEKYASLSRRDKPVISAKNAVAPHRVDWRIETDESVTDYAFMCWKDLIRTKWKRNRYDFLKDTVATYVSYLSKARIITAARISHAPLILFFYPAILVIAAFLVSLIAAVVGGWIYWLLFPALMVGLFFIFRTWQPTWLLHTFSFNMDLCKNNRRDLEERCAAFADDTIAFTIS